MSASKDKKLRATQRLEGTEKRQVAHGREQREHKRRRTREIIIGAVLVVVLVAVFIINSSLFYQGTPAVSAAGRDYTTAQFNYFYYTNYYNYLTQLGNYASMLGLDSSKPLGQQPYYGDPTISWADYFKNSTLDQMESMSVLLNAADADGLTLTDEQQSNIDAQLASVETSAKSGGYANADQYLSARYGKYFDEATLRQVLQMSSLASAYYTEKMASFTYTEDQLESYYSDNKNTLDEYTFRAYFISGAADTAADTTADADASPDASASPAPSPDNSAAMAAAKAAADAIVAGSTSEDAYNDLVYANAPEDSKSTYEDGGGTLNSAVSGSNVDASYSDWLFDSARKAGDVTSIATDNGYYAVMFLSRDDNHYPLREARHILIEAQASSDGTYSDDAKAAAQQQAEQILDEWKAGAATQDSFAQLAEQYSQDTGSKDNGGLYDEIYQGEMVPNFDAWVFDANRQPGDTGIVYGEATGSYAGYHVIYYVGENTELYSDYLAKNAMQTNDYNDWMTAEEAGVTTQVHALPMFFAR